MEMTAQKDATMVKVTVNLPAEDVQTLKELATKRRTTLTQIFRQAIATEKFVEEQLRSGGKLLIEQNGRLREVVFKT